MKKTLILLLVTLRSLNAFAAKTDSTLSKQTEYLVDGVYGYRKLVGIVPFYIEGTHGMKSTYFEPYRMGCLGMTFNVKVLEEIREAINNTIKKISVDFP